ncbi:MAG: hypothetical protein HYR90_02215 [Candidatus Andersenbacteria bacterium]|nr:hypothetical protein [Candidatus Andersenbacteria bacterium]MBI3250974.1 hypothetical protein [Candidatus Andersenbacteria bacterium]
MNPWLVTLLAMIFVGAMAVNIRKVVRKIQRRNRERAESHRAREKQRKEEKRLEIIKRYPLTLVTSAEFSAFPRREDLPEDFLQESFVGTQFVFASEQPKDPVVIGQVVKGDDLLCSQWGAGLCVPTFGINRYRVRIIPSPQPVEA